jgi:hypothetical protein
MECNNETLKNDQMEVDEIKHHHVYPTITDSSKKHPLYRASLDLCPKKFSIDDKTENQYSLNVELDDADYLNSDPLDCNHNDFDYEIRDVDNIVNLESESKIENDNKF